MSTSAVSGLAFDADPVGTSGERHDDHQQFAFDKQSVRRTDDFGRMHVANTNISKANVCTYYGYEIPGHESLGLDANKGYQIYRDPEELRKGAPSFNRLQILNKHIAVTADDAQHSSVVGTTGDGAVFAPPYLQNSATIWDSSAIAGINTGEQRELSASYKWTPDMTPGTAADGEPYDGRMTNIVGNHVALVPVGRAGSDVLVNDAKPQPPQLSRKTPMKVTDRRAARAVLAAHVLPSLAQDSAVNDIKGFMSKAAKDVTTEQLAADAAAAFPDAKVDAAALTAALDFAMDEETEQEKKDNESEAMRINNREKIEKETSRDDDDEDDKKKAKAKKDDDKPAMDAATVAAQARTEAMRDFNALRTAERTVRPYVGELAEDSAEATYKVAMDQMGIDYTDVHPSAFPKLIEMHGKMSEAAAARPDHFAMDAESASDFHKRFPTANRPARG